MTSDFDGLKEAAMKGAKKISQGFTQADDDFLPVFQYVDGEGRPNIIGITGELTESTKDRIAETMFRVLAAQRARAASLLLSAWMATAPENTPLELLESGRLHASRMPNRKEVLFLQIADEKLFEVWLADLIRYDHKPPTIGDWKQITDVSKFEGRFQLEQIMHRARKANGRVL